MKRKPRFLKFHSPEIGKAECDEVLDTLKSGWLTTGEKTRKFEKKFADYIGVKYAVGLNSCTAGLHLGLLCAGVGPGDEVITSPITFPATANVIVHAGATPVFADVDPSDLNISPLEIEKRITRRTKAIIPVHLGGNACDMDAIIRIARKRHLAVIGDCAHAIETEWRGRKIGSYGTVNAFSFYATKNITTAEGGMLVTNSRKIAEKARILSLHGINADAWKRYGEGGYRHFEVLYPGFKYNMSDVQASLGLRQMDRIQDFYRRRKAIVARYNKAFAGIPQVCLLSGRPHSQSAHHLYMLILATDALSISRDKFVEAMQKKHHIGVSVHFRALHLQKYYRERFKVARGVLSSAEYASERVVSLPLYPGMTARDVERVIFAVRTIIKDST
jgi:dTDP-4-amino-4,6-dideoxygalactose transaminase